jgi:hypothetical protein
LSEISPKRTRRKSRMSSDVPELTRPPVSSTTCKPGENEADKRSSRLMKMSLNPLGRLLHLLRLSIKCFRWPDRERPEPHSSKASRITTGGLCDNPSTFSTNGSLISLRNCRLMSALPGSTLPKILTKLSFTLGWNRARSELQCARRLRDHSS